MLEEDLRSASNGNHLVALALVILADRKKNKELFLHAYHSIKIENLEKPKNVEAIAHLMKKFELNSILDAFKKDINKIHGEKFDEILSNY